MRPTTTDLAREAEVSLATVDRVLNDRTGVSAKTQRRVNAAIKKLGYTRDVTAANLAKKRHYNLVFVLPDDSSQFQKTLIDEIQLASFRAASERSTIQLIRVPPNEPHTLVSELRKCQHQQVDGIAIMAAETPQVRDAISELKQNNIAIVALVSDQPNSQYDHFIGINNIAAGRTAAKLMGRFVPRSPGKIIVITNSLQSHDSVDRRLGFDDTMSKRFPNLEVLPTLEGHNDKHRVEQALANASQYYDNVVGVYSLSSGNRAITNTLLSDKFPNPPVVIAHELTKHTRKALQNESIDAVITQDTGHIVRSALRILRAKSDQVDIDSSQERIRIEIVLKENLDKI